jgi:hypothetical protein
MIGGEFYKVEDLDSTSRAQTKHYRIECLRLRCQIASLSIGLDAYHMDTDIDPMTTRRERAWEPYCKIINGSRSRPHARLAAALGGA